MRHTNTFEFSVIIPVFNGENCISDTLNSIINQSFKDIEVICINDGSTDRTAYIIENYCEKDNRIKLISKANEGQGYARKVALKHARGKYILFCDHDDIFCNQEAFSKIYDRMETTGAELLFFDFLIFYNHNIIQTDNDYFPDKHIFTHIDIGPVLLNRYFAPWFKAYRKDFLEKYTDWYMPKKMLLDDPPFHVQTILRAKNITHLKENLYNHRPSESSVTGRKKTIQHIEDCCIFILKIKEILEQENLFELYEKEFIFFTVNHCMLYLEAGNHRQAFYEKFQKLLLFLKDSIQNTITSYPFEANPPYPYLNKEQITFYKIMIRLSPDNIEIYKDKKQLKPFKKEIKALNKYNSELLNNIGKNQREIAQKEGIITDTQNVLTEKECILTDLKSKLTEKECILTDLQSKLNEKENNISYLQNELQDSNKNNIDLSNSYNSVIKSASFKIGRAITGTIAFPYEIMRKTISKNSKS